MVLFVGALGAHGRAVGQLNAVRAWPEDALTLGTALGHASVAVVAVGETVLLEDGRRLRMVAEDVLVRGNVLGRLVETTTTLLTAH